MKKLFTSGTILHLTFTVILSSVVIFSSYKKSGGDIFTQLMIGGIVFLQLGAVLIASLFKKFNYKANTLGILFGCFISIIILLIANELAIK